MLIESLDDQNKRNEALLRITNHFRITSGWHFISKILLDLVSEGKGGITGTPKLLLIDDKKEYLETTRFTKEYI